jgi:hypothetical protein
VEGVALSPADLGLARARIVCLGAIGGVLALAASGVFDHRLWSFLIAPAVPTAVALVTCGRSAVLRLIGAIASILVAVGAVVAIAGGSVDDFSEAFSSGAQRLISTEWPSPARPDMLGTAALTLALTTAIAAELARHRRWHTIPLVPLIVEYVAIIATSAPGGSSRSACSCSCSPPCGRAPASASG